MKHVAAVLLVLLIFAACYPMAPPGAGTRAPAFTVEAAYGEARRALARCCLALDVLLSAEDTSSIAFIAATPIGFVLGYDRAELLAISEIYGWPAVVGIFGHELGHAILQIRGADNTQAAADEWAGCALRVAGYPVNPYVRVIRSVTGRDPAHALRGYERCP
jgi:hypothetical protein